MKILVCEPGKHPYVKEIEHTLENLQKEVGGYIQALYPFEEEVAWLKDWFRRRAEWVNLMILDKCG